MSLFEFAMNDDIIVSHDDFFSSSILLRIVFSVLAVSSSSETRGFLEVFKIFSHSCRAAIRRQVSVTSISLSTPNRCSKPIIKSLLKPRYLFSTL
ncbi:unnamed protein product [Trichobilharzia szidati]|nr:unnamed protein product [Trichobilharzia szidati]